MEPWIATWWTAVVMVRNAKDYRRRRIITVNPHVVEHSQWGSWARRRLLAGDGSVW